MKPTNRAGLIAQLARPVTYDVAVIGGGATGLGVALDAAARGFSVLVVESHDFAKGTSSRATKLVHGGVRYLAQGNIALVREALHERTTLLANAPHLAQPLAFVMPSYKFWEAPFYGLGLKIYDALAGKAGLGATEFLNRDETLALLPNSKRQGAVGKLCGGVKYWDGQFDDARLALALARTAAEQGALLVNYCGATGLLHEAGKVVGIQVKDQPTGKSYAIKSGCVVNATGVWVDHLRMEDGAAIGRNVKPMVAPSQGTANSTRPSAVLGISMAWSPGKNSRSTTICTPWLDATIGLTLRPMAAPSSMRKWSTHTPVALTTQPDLMA